MREHLSKPVLRLGLLGAVLGAAGGFVACADALHLDPPRGLGTVDGGGGDGGAACLSSPDCAHPTPICDTVTQACVACLVLSDCAGAPGTVCSRGSCVCPDGDTCLSTAWKATALLNAPQARSHHVAVWTGTQMVIWGGKGTGPEPLRSGAVYDPVKDAWTPTSIPAALEGRYDATAVWDDADQLMLVWGGIGAGGIPANDGWRYQPPPADKWTPMTALPSPIDGGVSDAGATGVAGRSRHTAVWATALSGIPGFPSTKAAMIVWGGMTADGPAGDGAMYDPAMNVWTLVPAGDPGEPSARASHAAVWDAAHDRMLVFGGATSASALADDGTYALAPSGTWSKLAASSAPGARQKHSGVWDPVTTALLVWGGVDGASKVLGDGASLGTSNTWAPLGATGAGPEGRADHTAVLLAGPDRSELVVFGGADTSGILAGGWSLEVGPGGVWSRLPAPGPTPRQSHTAVATTTPGSSTPGASMIVWGGETATGVYTNSGAVYLAQ